MIYAIGDIHGELDLLEKMIETLRADASSRGVATPTLVFVGDYVDRGADSKGVVDRLRRPIDGFETVCLFGNHERLFLDFLHEVDPDHAIMYFRKNAGGAETLKSYGLDMKALEKLVRKRKPYGHMLGQIPSEHVSWLSNLPLFFETESHYFVHAGVLPGVPLEEQVEYDQIWIRNEFLEDLRDHGKLIVHGHTPCRGGEMLANRINVDSGACYWGGLLAVALSDEAPRFIEVHR